MNEPNKPTSFKIYDGYVWITLQDGRIIAAPLNWYDWLEQVTAEQRGNFILGSFSIAFPELEDGIDVDSLLVGAAVPNA